MIEEATDSLTLKFIGTLLLVWTFCVLDIVTLWTSHFAQLLIFLIRHNVQRKKNLQLWLVRCSMIKEVTVSTTLHWWFCYLCGLFVLWTFFFLWTFHIIPYLTRSDQADSQNNPLLVAVLMPYDKSKWPQSAQHWSFCYLCGLFVLWTFLFCGLFTAHNF